jgi:hypothetical protein
MPYVQPELEPVDRLRERARDLRRAGRTVRQIHAELPQLSRTKLLGYIRDIPPARRNLRVRHKDEVREKARELRLQGRTYTEIAAALGISKSTCSVWCADLPAAIPGPGKKRASTWGSRLQRRDERRQAVKERARNEVMVLSTRELMLVGTALYWAEGAKDKPWQRREELLFTNMDPDVITVYLAWLDMLGVPAADRGYRIQIHQSADLAAAHAYWADIVGIGVTDFAKPTIKRHKPLTKRKNRGETYHGCLVVRVKQSAERYWRMDGWWRGVVDVVRDARLGSVTGRELRKSIIPP